MQIEIVAAALDVVFRQAADALAGAACQRDGASGFFNCSFADSQAEAGAAGGAGARRIAAVETIEDMWQSGGVDAVATILNGEFGRLVANWI